MKLSCDAYERISVVNYGQREVRLPLTLQFAADFRDMFEVRGSVRPRRGQQQPVELSLDAVRFGYRGLDEAMRASHLAFSRAPDALDGDGATFEFRLEPGVRQELYLECGVEAGPTPCAGRFRDVIKRPNLSIEDARAIENSALIATVALELGSGVGARRGCRSWHRWRWHNPA